jgi:pimeloyl-ACP methyl ester carboxylesterase
MRHQNHTLEITVGPGRQHRAWWSLDPTGKLLLFIHGFGGHAVKTWRFFPKLLLNDNVFSGYDLFFYSYESRRVAALANAVFLLDFLNPFLSNPAYLINDQVDPKRSFEDFHYSEIYIIAHSLGAPIARKMLLRAADNKSKWVPKVKLVFFAPATAGARAEALARSLGSQGILPLTLLYSLFSYNYPVTDDLRTGSQFLTELYSETNEAISSDSGAVFRSSGTFFGEREKVIELKQELPWDSPYTFVKAKDHFNICKPRRPQDAIYVQLRGLVNGKKAGRSNTRNISS